ncbi:MAG: hypothetical protein GEU73_12820 [Chloroflexi bacterium]|nr:hypothetical protein [Chloroflexota bacterium]
MELFDLGSLSEHDQLVTELTRRAGAIGQFYRAMVDGGLPEDLARKIVLEWARASLRASELPPCGCDCEVCRGEV